MSRPKDVNAHQRAMQALSLRTEGHTYEEIAETLGYSGRASAYNAVSTLLQRQEVESVEKLRAFAGSRYEAIIRELFEMVNAQSGSVAERVSAARAIIRAQDSLNRLYGLNTVPEVHGTGSAQLMIVEAETLSNNMAEVLVPDMPRPDLGEIIDVEVDDE